MATEQEVDIVDMIPDVMQRNVIFGENGEAGGLDIKEDIRKVFLKLKEVISEAPFTSSEGPEDVSTVMSI